MTYRTLQKASVLRVALVFVIAGLIIGGNACEETVIKPAPTVVDSTTHSWRFEVDSLGGYLSTVRGIAAFSEKNAWITGTFYIYPDSNDPSKRDLYNLAHWDGNRWTLKQFPRPPLGDGQNLFAVDSQFIVLVSFGLFVYDGEGWRQVNVPQGTFNGINGIWGKSRKEIHFVGNAGTWTVWNGDIYNPTFRRLNTDTHIDLLDIYGDGDKIYACGGMDWPNYEVNIVLEYESGKFRRIDHIDPYKGGYAKLSLWYSRERNTLAMGGGRQRLFIENNKLEADSNASIIPLCMSVRGSSVNNIWWVGHFVSLVHYNGSSFRVFRQPFPQDGVLTKIHVGKDYFFSGGYQGLQNGLSNAIVVRGYRNE